MTRRAYDATKRIWDIKWLNALRNSVESVLMADRSSAASKEPLAAHAFTCATYTNVSQDHFTWRGEKSDDGKAWSEFMVVEVRRDKE
jgi:hypothetical protein